MIFLPSTPSRATVSLSSAARTARMFALGGGPSGRSRKPSTLYSLAQVTTRVHHQLAHHACSRARSWRSRWSWRSCRRPAAAGSSPGTTWSSTDFGSVAGGRRVVVDHVHDDAAGRPALTPATICRNSVVRAAPSGFDGVAALRHGVVQRVVPPVVAVRRPRSASRRLAAGRSPGGSAARSQAACCCSGPPLGDRGEVEHRQQVQVGDPGVAERLQVLHAGRVRCR